MTAKWESLLKLASEMTGRSSCPEFSLDKEAALCKLKPMNPKTCGILCVLVVCQLYFQNVQPIQAQQAQPIKINLNALTSTNEADKEKVIHAVTPNVELHHDVPQPDPYNLVPLEINGKSVLPFNATVVETAETKESKDICKQVAEFFQAKKYDQIDTLAAKYRSSKECFSNGHWKLGTVYSGLLLPKNASEQEWESRLADLRNWIAARPDSITARVALADALVSYAWKARGNGYANTVTSDGWRLFSERILKAANVLIEAKNLKEQCPEYELIRMEVGAAGQIYRSQFDRTFKEAVSREPEFELYYVERANFLLPRWYGEPGEWEKDLEQSADHLGGENGDILYSQVVWDMRSYFTNVFKENNLSWSRVSKGLQAVEKNSPNSLTAKSRHAYLAALADDKNIAKNYFDQTKGEIDLSVWGSTNRYLSFATYLYLK